MTYATYEFEKEEGDPCTTCDETGKLRDVCLECKCENGGCYFCDWSSPEDCEDMTCPTCEGYGVVEPHQPVDYLKPRIEEGQGEI